MMNKGCASDALDGYTAGYFGEQLDDKKSDIFRDSYECGQLERKMQAVREWYKAHPNWKDEIRIRRK